MTDLFVALRGLDARAVGDAMPPTVRRTLEVDASPIRDGADLLLDLGPWRPRTPASHLVPSLALLTATRHAFRFEIAGCRGDRWTSWVATATVGDHDFSALPPAADGVTAEIDEVQAAPPLDAVRLRVRMTAASAESAITPWLVTLSLWDGTAASAVRPIPTPVHLAVPPRTQLTEPEPVRMRICSPTSLGMALEYLGRAVPTRELADAVFHRATDRYGVWSAAVHVAAAHGVPGYLLRFPDWEAVAWCLEHGSPVVASIRFAEGELSNAPLPHTTGHLVVITGLDGSDVLVNDPAAASVASVARRYPRDEFSRVWLERSGVGYVFFRAG
jgi:hypothetical protein